MERLAVSVNRMLDRLEQLLDEIRGVGDDIAHDLRTPLARVRAGLRSRTILALSPADVVADARCFAFATGFARARGYRVLLRVDAPGLLGVLAPTLPEFDHVALAWSDTLPAGSDALFTEPERLVLTGCDSQHAIAWGLASGVQLFTGPAASQAALA